MFLIRKEETFKDKKKNSALDMGKAERVRFYLAVAFLGASRFLLVLGLGTSPGFVLNES